MQNAIIFNDVAIVAMKRSNSIIYFWCMSKDKAINLCKNADFTEKKWNIKNKNLLTHIKLVNSFFVIRHSHKRIFSEEESSDEENFIGRNFDEGNYSEK